MLNLNSGGDSYRELVGALVMMFSAKSKYRQVKYEWKTRK